MKKEVVEKIIKEAGIKKLLLVLGISQGHGGYSESSMGIGINSNQIKLYDSYIEISGLSYQEKNDCGRIKTYSHFRTSVEDGFINKVYFEYETILAIGE